MISDRLHGNGNPAAGRRTSSPLAGSHKPAGLGSGEPVRPGGMGWRVLLPVLVFLLAGCAGTRPQPPPPMTADLSTHTAAGCTAIFPQGRWQFTHAIEFHLADGTTGNALGVLIVDGRSLSCALMTVEGLTLFEARSQGDGALEILRALPPFSGQAFATGLIADIRTLFQPPPGTASVGRLADGRALCRYAASQVVTDVFPGPEGGFTLVVYAPKANGGLGHPLRSRTVEGRGCSLVGGNLLARDLTLVGHGPAGYTLNLRLLSADPLPAARP